MEEREIIDLGVGEDGKVKGCSWGSIKMFQGFLNFKKLIILEL